MKLKQFKAVVLNKQTNKPKPLSLSFLIFRRSDTFKNLFLGPLQFSNVTNSGQTLIQRDFFWSHWCPGLLRLLCGACSVSERSTGCFGKDGGYWPSTGSAFLITGDVLGGIYYVCILMSISGDSGFSTPSWDRLTPHLEASFPSENLRGSQGAGLTTHGHLE